MAPDLNLSNSADNNRHMRVQTGDVQRVGDRDLPTEEMILNMGPSHPATHGTVHIKLALDGERIASAQVNVGYLHRGFEKEAEAHTWAEIFPYTDRLNYVSPCSIMWATP